MDQTAKGGGAECASVFESYAGLPPKRKVNQRQAAWAVMEEAYLKASSNNTLPAHARQIMYAARGRIQEITGKPLKDSYFTQTLLPDYMREYPEKTAGWDVVFDARGHFHEPHTGRVVPLGTLSVRQYLDSELNGQGSVERIDITSGGLFPTWGPENRFRAILFIEKEGFLPLFQTVKLAERFDIAIMSTKGLSVTASRSLVDRLCGRHRIPLLVLHDFDQAGFSILGTLSRDTRRYTFLHDIEVVDLGLRLDDVVAYELEPEEVNLSSDRTKNLLENDATPEEVEFLCSGKRVELNAFTSDQLVRWIESKLTELGIRKFVPSTSVIELGYRRELTNRIIREQLPDLVSAAQRQAQSADLPDDIQQRVTDHLQANPSEPWDLAVAAIVKQQG